MSLPVPGDDQWVLRRRRLRSRPDFHLPSGVLHTVLSGPVGPVDPS